MTAVLAAIAIPVVAHAARAATAPAGTPARAATEAATAPSGDFPAVTPGYTLQFPRDYGAHPRFRIEWWYATGWLAPPRGGPLGFQVTFFRIRNAAEDANPSAFTPHQLLIAHVALSDPAHGSLWHDQRIRRAGFGLVQASTQDTDVRIDDWTLHRDAATDTYHAQVMTQDFGLQLALRVTQPLLLNGQDGYSQKGPASQSASYYYSETHLAVSGRITRAGRTETVSGEAWLDHEWASSYLDPQAAGWDWIGINLDDGGALMAFRIRGRDSQPHWAGATLRDAAGHTQAFGPGQIRFSAQRRWRSPHTGVRWPIRWQVQIGARRFDIVPLMDDQENDTRASSNALYWEGAVRALQDGRQVGRGYLELTGYDRPLSMGTPQR